MATFRIVPIASEIAEHARAAGGEIVIADEPHAFPCRHCLSDAASGERMLLVPHSPFALEGPYHEVGPIFVHAAGCERRAVSGEIPEQLRRRLLAVRGYDARERMLAADVTDGRELEALIERTFQDSNVHFIHVRFARPGCFACRVERA